VWNPADTLPKVRHDALMTGSFHSLQTKYISAFSTTFNHPTKDSANGNADTFYQSSPKSADSFAPLRFLVFSVPWSSSFRYLTRQLGLNLSTFAGNSISPGTLQYR
jgi:hypothetical protein